MLISISPVWAMIGLDTMMIIYSFWILSYSKPLGSKKFIVLGVLAAWLLVLHLGLSNQVLFDNDISGIAFLMVIFAGVGAVGALLFIIPAIRKLVVGMDQRQLMLMQGIRVFFGAVFLMWASTGDLPQAFGTLDGFTHIGAGFFGLIAAFSVATGVQERRRVWFANLFGLTDILVVASTLALVLLPQIGPHHPMMYAVFLPAPLWLWFHVISIWKLLCETDRANANQV